MMGFFSFFRFFYILAIFFFCILLLPNLPPYNVKFTKFYITPSKPLTGKLALNTLLNNTERIFENKIKGPEAFEVVNGELYTTLHGGFVVKIKNDKILPIVQFGQSCDHWWEEHTCGRPLGLAALGDDLFVADAYYGIFKYNVKEGKDSIIVDKDVLIEGKKPGVFNSVAVGKDGSIYWTDSTSDFSLRDGVYAFLADPSGRLIKYDPRTKRNTVLLDKLYFANGVALSDDEEFVVVAETGHGRIQKVYLKGPKKLQTDIFVDGLPGLPDNLRSNGKGGFFVSLNVARDENTPLLTEFISPFPFVRKSLARLLAIADWCAEQIDKLYPSYYTKRLIHIIGHFEMISPFHPLRTTFLELDNSGNILQSYHGLDGSITSISDVIVYNGHLYLGSPYNTYLGRIQLLKFGDKLIDPTKRQY